MPNQQSQHFVVNGCSSDFQYSSLSCHFVCVCREQQQSVQHRQTDWAGKSRPQGSGQRNQQLPCVGGGGLQQRRGQHAELREGEEEEGGRRGDRNEKEAVTCAEIVDLGCSYCGNLDVRKLGI